MRATKVLLDLNSSVKEHNICFTNCFFWIYNLDDQIFFFLFPSNLDEREVETKSSLLSNQIHCVQDDGLHFVLSSLLYNLYIDLCYVLAYNILFYWVTEPYYNPRYVSWEIMQFYPEVYLNMQFYLEFFKGNYILKFYLLCNYILLVRYCNTI